MFMRRTSLIVRDTGRHCSLNAEKRHDSTALSKREHMKIPNQLGELVRNRRAGLGLTQRSLAQKLGVEASHVAFIESGRRKPSLKRLAA
jgi:ribosome-binding protein aMBF1 (putative translation factor)